MLVTAIIGTNDSIIDVACWPRADVPWQVLMKAKAIGLKAAVTKLVEAAGGKLEAYYFAFGQRAL